MPSLISHLSKTEQQKLLDDLNYLNIAEFRNFCRQHAIPYTIWVETPTGTKKMTRDTDRKSVVLARIRHYLNTGIVPRETCFPAHVVRLHGPPETLTSSARLYYGWYHRENGNVFALLRALTDGKFKDGAIARILAREFWTQGQAPTFAEFADAWIKAEKNGLGAHPEAAWLTDRSRNEAGKHWKLKRALKAEKVLGILGRIAPA